MKSWTKTNVVGFSKAAAKVSESQGRTLGLGEANAWCDVSQVGFEFDHRQEEHCHIQIRDRPSAMRLDPSSPCSKHPQAGLNTVIQGNPRRMALHRRPMPLRRPNTAPRPTTVSLRRRMALHSTHLLRRQRLRDDQARGRGFSWPGEQF